MIKNTLFIILTFLLFFLVNSYIPKTKKFNKSRQVLLPDKIAPIISVGQKDLTSSLLWINLIQNSTVSKDKYPFEFNRSTLISKLSPLFYFNYKFSGMTVSIVKDQFKNSNKILERGISFFPSDYDLNFQLAFNHFFLLENKEIGVKFYDYIYHERIYEDSNPVFPVMYSNIKKKLGDKKVARGILQELYEKTDNENIKKALEHRLNQ